VNGLTADEARELAALERKAAGAGSGDARPWWAKFGLQMVPATVGGGVGAAIGALPPLPAVTGGLSIPAGMVLGTAAGEAVSQYVDPLGVRQGPPSALNVGIAGGTALAGPAIRSVGHALPGVEAGLMRYFLSEVGRSGERLIERYVAPVAGGAGRLFGQAAQAAGGLRIGTQRIATALNDLVTSADPQPVVKAARGPIDRLLQAAQAQGGDVSWQQFRATMTRLGEVIGAIKAKGGVGLGEAKKLYGAMWDELNTLQFSATPVLKEAVEAFKREKAAEFITGSFTKSRTYPQGIEQVLPSQLMKRIEANRDMLEKLIPKDTIDGMMATLQKFGTTPAVSPVQRMGAAPSLGVAGGTAGRLATTATGLEAMGQFLMSPSGQAVVGFMARHGYGFDQVVNAMGQAVRAGIMTPGLPGGEEEAVTVGAMAPPLQTGTAPEAPLPFSLSGLSP
jgi:hypothetical protein